MNNRRNTYFFLLMVGVLSACEDVYTPAIESQDNVIVVDARIVIGESENDIRLSNSLSYNEKVGSYESFNNASVCLIDNNNKEYILNETETAVFEIGFPLNKDLQYKLRIEQGGKIYESGFESVPETPELDSVYGMLNVRDVKISGDNDVDDFMKIAGVLLYGDISPKTDFSAFRFTAKKIKQYSYKENLGQFDEQDVFAWRTYFPHEAFNIAEPPIYAKSEKIKKHPLFFLEDIPFITSDMVEIFPQRARDTLSYFINVEEKFWGWILIMHQYSLSKSAYTFYTDLNNQLESNGKLFAPVFVQARNNLKCINDPKQNILGQFEISAVREYRYYIRYISKELGFEMKEIPYFYEIPSVGKERGTPPNFWETLGKIYPNE